MKKSIIALTLVFGLVISGSVFAAGINFDGYLETNLEWNRDLEGNLETRPSSELGLNFGLDTDDDRTKAVVEIGLEDKNEEGLDLDLDASNLVLKKAYIETAGSFWYGGPQATTRFGSLEVDYGPFATDKEQYGISVNGMDVGPARISAFYGIPTEEHQSIQGVHAGMTIADIAAGAAVIHDYDSVHVVVDGAVSPMKDLLIGGAFATQLDLDDDEEIEEEANFDRLMVIGAEYLISDNMSVHGGYRSVSSDWKPAYIADKSKDDRGQNWLHEEDRNDSGLYAGIVTDQQGILIKADYDQIFDEASLSAATNLEGFDVNVETALNVNKEDGISTKNTKLGVNRSFAVIEGLDIDAKYIGEWNPGNGLSHTIGAGTELGLVPAIDGMNLNTEVTVSDLETIGYAVGASFEAPNGVNLAVEHVGGNYADESIETGTTAKAGIAVKF